LRVKFHPREFDSFVGRWKILSETSGGQRAVNIQRAFGGFRVKGDGIGRYRSYFKLPHAIYAAEISRKLSFQTAS